MNAFRRLWKFIDPNRRKQLVLLLLVMALASFAEVVSIGTVLPFLGVLLAPDMVLEYSLVKPLAEKMGITVGQQLLLPLTIIFVAAALFSGAMRLMMLWAQTRVVFAIGADLSIQIYKKTLCQPYHVHIGRNNSQIISGILKKTNSAINYSLLPLLFVGSSSLILVAIFGTLLAISPTVALITFGVFGAIYGLIAVGTKSFLSRNSQRISLESDRVIKALQEGLGGIRDVLIDGTQNIYCQIYRDADLPLRKSQANVLIVSGSPRYLMESLGIAFIAILAYQLSNSPDGLSKAIPILGLLALGAQRMLPVLQQLYSSWSSIRGNRSSLEDVLELLDQPLNEYATRIDPQAIKFDKSIELIDVGFCYAPDTNNILRGINLEIPKGCSIGLVGVTGSGKSTLLDVIMGLLRPTEGRMLIDGILITEQNYRSWQNKIAHVPQSIFLADATIAENIAFGVLPENIDMQRVRLAANLAKIAESIESWPKQYDTLVGERGIRLSGGQRQRIGIARALYKKSEVIILDEATSALDNRTESEVMEAIDNFGGKITTIIVAHRLTTLKKCSIICEIENGLVKRVEGNVGLHSKWSNVHAMKSES